MIFVFVSYNYSPKFNSPASWLKRTEVYAGILECLSKENTVINVKQINYEGLFNHKGVQHHFVNLDKGKSRFAGKLNRYVRDLKPDVVVVQGLHHPLKLMNLRFKLNKATRIIVQHHAEKPFKGVKKHIQKMANGYVDAFLFASLELGMDWVKRGNIASQDKIHEVMEVSSAFYPVDKASATEKTKADGKPVFLWVGRLNENKDPLTVVSAFLKFAEAETSARLYMIFQTRELLARVVGILYKSKNKDAVKMVGKIQHHELLNWYSSADFIISGSHYEGSGTAICEAMSCGCIPVVTDIPSFRMMTDQGECGLLYPAGDEEALLSALMQTSIMNVQEKQNRSLAYFRSNLSFQAIADRIQKIAASL